ncbi:hypothetical protein LV457_05275 [Mycobacterium sp. MYCO198283]|uniref:hypothetical protein n=1 Tax=Mycobacterium sp. MYCO198283 TaxID=2883505 RepID=UPI001E5F39FC|nr:hypothetical protein [Mycobacterium sp. MYCO198283]MCG5431703.1 hypothetical protein [Mycobacterium sp. MYCO198283]
MASSDPPPEVAAIVTNAEHTLRVWVSDRGLPLRVDIAADLARRGGRVLADEVLAACRAAR